MGKGGSGRRNRVVLAVAVVLVVSLFGLAPAAGAPGDLDASFDADGVVRTQPTHPRATLVESTATSVAVQADGKVVVAGGARDATNATVFAVVRHNADGSFDTDFGSGGIARTQAADPNATTPFSLANDVAVQSDGKIVVAGTAADANNDGAFAVVRYNANGSLDAGFGDRGIARTQATDPNVTPAVSSVSGVAIQGDGKIVVTGFARDATSSGVFAVVRYNQDGTLDVGFGSGGIVRTQAGDPNAAPPGSQPGDVAIQGDGRIVVAGFATDAAGSLLFAVVRYNQDGTLDVGFGGGGIVRTQAAHPNAPFSQANGVAVQGDGKVVVSGQAADATSNGVFGVVRYNPDGTLDAGFGGGGIVRTQAAHPNANVQNSIATGVAIQADGRIVTAGGGFTANSDRAVAVARYDPDGSLDTGFGDGGIARTPTDHPNAAGLASGATDVAIQADGRIVAAGSARDANNNFAFAVVRYEGTPPGAVAQRIGGADRYATAALVAQQLGGCEVAVASGENFPDGLAGSVLGLPVLLTRSDSLPAPTTARLDAMQQSCPNGVEAIVVLGGPAAVSADVFAQLRGYTANIDRLHGADRYETAIAIAAHAGVGDTVIVATGEDFPDALAGGVLAAHRGIPIILNRGDTLRSNVAAFFTANPGIDQAFVLGGTAAVPGGVTDQLRSEFGITVRRLAGADRTATATAVADEVFPQPDCVLIANSRAFPDTLAAGPLGAAQGCPITLVNNDSIPIATRQWFVANAATLDRVVAIGGTAVVGNLVLTTTVALA